MAAEAPGAAAPKGLDSAVEPIHSYSRLAARPDLQTYRNPAQERGSIDKSRAH